MKAGSALGIFDFLKSPDTARSSAETDTVRRIVDSLDQLDPDRARYLAAFAYVLSRVARADLKVSPEETRAMERIVLEHGRLPEEQAILVVQVAKHQNLFFGATEDFLVTREFNRISSYEQKIQLLDCLFSIAAAEQMISVTEENEIRKVASELGIPHEDYIEVRSRHREHRAVLRKPDDRLL
jgi:uncharacterized tellurite resistance protein B-like protein